MGFRKFEFAAKTHDDVINFIKDIYMNVLTVLVL